jgi:hypothetical protein
MWRKLKNGDMFAPHRGTVPTPPKGYVRDSRNPHLVHPDIRNCEHRFIFKEQLSCGKIEKIIECSLKNLNVTQLECFTCEVKNVDSKGN